METISVPVTTYLTYYNPKTDSNEVEIETVHGTAEIQYQPVTARFGIQRCPEPGKERKWSAVYVKLSARWSGAWIGVFDSKKQAVKMAEICEGVLTDDAIEKYYAGKISKLAKQRKLAKELYAEWMRAA